MKIKCTKCKVEKELNESNFFKKRHNLTGYSGECKVCTSNYKSKKYPKKRNDWMQLWVG